MRQNRIRLRESDLNRIVKKSVNKIIKEAYDPYEDGDEYEELIVNLKDAYNDYFHAIQKIQDFVFKHDDTATDMYNSAAGKYGDEAKDLLGRSYNRISQLFYEEEY